MKVSRGVLDCSYFHGESWVSYFMTVGAQSERERVLAILDIWNMEEGFHAHRVKVTTTRVRPTTRSTSWTP